LWPVDSARAFAEHFAEIGPQLIAARVERRARRRAAGLPDADSMRFFPWHYPGELLPALASLSPDAESRALALMKDRWTLARAGSLLAQREAVAEQAGLPAGREEIIQQAKRAAEMERDKDPMFAGLAISFPPLLPPTREMDAVADALIAEQRRAWEEEVARFRRQGRDV
jgi:hypothetical protein